jgi:hypothetical protein
MTGFKKLFSFASSSYAVHTRDDSKSSLNKTLANELEMGSKWRANFTAFFPKSSMIGHIDPPASHQRSSSSSGGGVASSDNSATTTACGSTGTMGPWLKPPAALSRLSSASAGVQKQKRPFQE